MNYIFPAIFHVAEEGGYWVDFPDLDGCFTEGNSFIEAYNMAKEALSEYLINCENEKESINFPSQVEDIILENGDKVNLINVDTILYRKEVLENKSIKKTLTIPAWLNELALSKNLNFSKTLQKALKIELGVE